MVEPGLRLGRQHRELRRAPRLLVPQDAYTVVEGRGHQADPEPRGAVRSATASAPTRSAPGPSRRRCSWTGSKGRGGRADQARPQPDRPVRQARGDRRHRPLPRRTSRAGRTAPTSSSTAGSPSTTSDRRPSIRPTAARWRRGLGGRHRHRCRRDRHQGRHGRRRPRRPSPRTTGWSRHRRRRRRQPDPGSSSRIGSGSLGAFSVAADARRRGVPVVVIDGVTKSAANIDPGSGRLRRRCRHSPRCASGRSDGQRRRRGGDRRDAVRGGFAAEGRSSCSRSGPASARRLIDGVLVPNTEFGHMELRGTRRG